MALAFATQTLQSAATSGNGSAYDTNGAARELVFYIIGSAGISAGEVQLEEAHDSAYAGTWSAFESPVVLIASTVIVKRYSGCLKSVRARISTNVVGGTVTVQLMGQEEES